MLRSGAAGAGKLGRAVANLLSLCAVALLFLSPIALGQVDIVPETYACGSAEGSAGVMGVIYDCHDGGFVHVHEPRCALHAGCVAVLLPAEPKLAAAAARQPCLPAALHAYRDHGSSPDTPPPICPR